MDSAWNLFNLNGRNRFDSRPALQRIWIIELHLVPNSLSGEFENKYPNQPNSP